MTNVGAQCRFLKASAELKKQLQAVGLKKTYSAGEILFREEDHNSGVFLVGKGRIRMSVRGLPKLDRLFSTGSLLGLPSTFTGHDYSLTAEAVADAEVIHVPQDSFVRIMREHPELCREATEMLGREVTFIQAALSERRKESGKSKLANMELSALS
jgi:CRP-like cAMP-binding protein